MIKNIWNSLTEQVVTSEYVDAFQNRYDHFNTQRQGHFYEHSLLSLFNNHQDKPSLR